MGYRLWIVEQTTNNDTIKKTCKYARNYVTNNFITSSIIKLLLSPIIFAAISRKFEIQADTQAVKWLGTNEGAASFITKCLHEDNIVQNFLRSVLLENPCWKNYKNFISVLPFLICNRGLLRSHPFFVERLKNIR